MNLDRASDFFGIRKGCRIAIVCGCNPFVHVGWAKHCPHPMVVFFTMLGPAEAMP